MNKGDWENLPVLLHAKILDYLRTGNDLYSLCSAAQVNRTWRAMAGNSTLWHDLSLTGPEIKQEDQTIHWIVSGRDVSQVRTIDVSGWSGLTNNGLMIIAGACPALTTIRLSGTRISSLGLAALANGCPLLESIDLSAISTDAGDGAGMTHLLHMRGSALRRLNLSSNTLNNFVPVMALISTTCTNLTTLDLRDMNFVQGQVVFDVESMQRSCSRLEALKLGGSSFRLSHELPSEKLSPGFRRLEELDVSVRASGEGVVGSGSAGILARLLRDARMLRSLNLFGCTNVTANGLRDIHATHLHRLYVANGSAGKYQCIQTIMAKWQATLVELDLSLTFCPATSILTAVKNSDPANSRLEALHLRGTQASLDSVRLLLDAFPRLTKLSLAHCIGLPRNMNKEYEGPAVDQLRRDVAVLAA